MRIGCERMKARINVTISKDLLERARKYDINVSAFLDIKLREYFAYIEGMSHTQIMQTYTPNTQSKTTQKQQKTHEKTNDSYGVVGLLRFERKSMAPEATRIPSYPTGPGFA